MNSWLKVFMAGLPICKSSLHLSRAAKFRITAKFFDTVCSFFFFLKKSFSRGSVVKKLPAMQGTQEMQVPSLARRIPWRRKWQFTPVFLPRKSHGQRNLEIFKILYQALADL